MTRNLDSMRSRPELPTALLTPREIERQIAHLHAKIAMLEEDFRKVTDGKVSRRVVEDMIGRANSAGRPRKQDAKASVITADSGPGGLTLRRIRALERWVEQQIERLDQRCRKRASEAKHDAAAK